ncbi:MAG TPA: DUF4350 domain-containing protein [Gemmatimonadaceae bacterium]|nr:DUF4350 domain-containing protein [Gemmatimonadaceae bacterium]
MSTGIVIGRRHIGTATLLLALVAVAIVVAVITPESAAPGSEDRGSYSAGPEGTRIVYELAERMGWRTARRETPLDSAHRITVQAVIAPQGALGAVEVHRLLDNVRRGGGLIFDIANAPDLADSIGMELARSESMLIPYIDAEECRRSVSDRTSFVLPPRVRMVRWRRPPPGVVTPISAGGTNRSGIVVGAAFPMGAGRVVGVSAPDIFANYFVRTCGWGADVASARALEFVRPAGVEHPEIVFDEYHHGYGLRGGSMRAISLYLAHAASGHFLVQALIAALILLLAMAPRPIVPRDPERIPRRSPLEHADALGHAYADVKATRTATSRLVGGIRRRAGRTVAIHAAANDSAFLDAVIRRTPTLAPSVGVVQRALRESIARREFAAVADALRDIEHQLTTSPPSSS